MQPRHRHREADVPAADPDRQGARPPAGRDQRPALHRQGGRTAHEVLLCVQTGATLADPTRFRFEAEEFYLKCPAEMRELFADYREACDNTLLIAERVQPPSFARSELLPAFPVPEGETEESWFQKEVERGVAPPLPDGPSDEAQRAQVDYEVRRHPADGLPGLLPRRRRPRRSTPRTTASGSARAVARPPAAWCRYCLGITELDPLQVRPDLRAVPQPRARVHARHRHGLRRAPALRHDPVRDRALRRGQGRADHHLRHDQGEGRDQGLVAGARLSLRDRRPADQDHAAAGHGQGGVARRTASTRRPPATPRRASCGRRTRPSPTSSGSSTPPAASRG